LVLEQSDLLLKAPLEDVIRGYAYQEAAESYVCLVCGRLFEKGLIYAEGDNYYEAEKYARHHIKQEHGSMFDYLLGLNKKLTGLTDLQKNLLKLFHDGHSDNEIVRQLDGGSASTIRNHRFALREKEKQAKLFLAIMELLEQKSTSGKENARSAKQQLVDIHRTATVRDERYAITEEEYHNLVLNFFKEGPEGPLSRFPTKEKRKIVILRHLITRFQVGKRYTEKEINTLLKEAFHDYVTLRRYMIEYGFMDREEDGSAYWVNEGIPAMTAERRTALLKAYKQMKRQTGVFQVRNTTNGKIFIGSSLNMDAMWSRLQLELKLSSSRNKQLQKDWKEFGEEAFIYEVLEELKESMGEDKDTGQELAAMEAKWIEKLQPFGEQGYNE
jgi:hypothetical protein